MGILLAYLFYFLVISFSFGVKFKVLLQLNISASLRMLFLAVFKPETGLALSAMSVIRHVMRSSGWACPKRRMVASCLFLRMPPEKVKNIAHAIFFFLHFVKSYTQV